MTSRNLHQALVSYSLFFFFFFIKNLSYKNLDTEYTNVAAENE